MQDTHERGAPAPGVVIAVGARCERACALARRIWLRGDAPGETARRERVTRFLALRAEGEMGLAELEAAPTAAKDGDPFVERRAGLRAALAAAGALRAQLDAALRETLVQENLVAAGWQDTAHVPANLYLALDLTEPRAAGVLPALLLLMQEAAEGLENCQLFLLLHTGLYGDENAADGDAGGYDPRVGLSTSLVELDELLRLESKPREALRAAMGLRGQAAPDAAVYLLDARKEDGTLVRDAEMGGLLLGNALLALLVDGPARRLSAPRLQEDGAASGSFYGSMGCAALVYHPGELQEWCARAAARNFVSETLLAPSEEDRAAQVAANLAQSGGRLEDWVDILAGSVAQAAGEGRRLAGAPWLGWSLSPELAELDFARPRETAWASALRERDRLAREELYPQARARAAAALAAEARARGRALEERFEDLAMAEGAQTVLRAAALLDQALEREQERARQAVTDARAALDGLEASLRTGCERLDAIFARAPRLPRVFSLLPDRARMALSGLYVLRRMGPRLQEAYRLRAQAGETLERVWAARLLAGALEGHLPALETLRAQVGEARVRMYAYLTALEGARDLLAQEDGCFAPDTEGFDPLYRAAALDAAAAERLRARWAPRAEDWNNDYRAALRGRRVERTPEGLTAWLLERGREQYRPLWALSLDDALREREDGAPGFCANWVDLAMRLSTPLLYPDFDAAGGAGVSRRARHALLGGPDWEICRLPAQATAPRWVAFGDGDRYCALLAQLRHCVPLRALGGVVRAAGLEALPPEMRARYLLLDEAGGGGLPATEGEDGLRRVFEWTFKPRGSSKMVLQRIAVNISRERYDYYHRLPRLAGQWNCYAEQEMPEVRDLAAEFARLHREQRWSTFNQAFNVLRFVQDCIPYAYDRDTTGHEDWARYPIETLVDGRGDCEDVAILCAAVIARLGFRVVLLLYPRHLAFGVAGADGLKGDYVTDPASGMKYFYGEATHFGWHLGQIPAAFHGMAPEQILPVNLLVEEG